MKSYLRGLIFFLISTIAMTGLQPTLAKRLKIRVLDLQMVLAQAPQAAAMREKISRQFAPKEEELKAAEINFSRDADRYELMKFKLKPLARKKAKEKMKARYEKLRRAQNEFEKDLSATQTSLHDTVLKQIQDIIEGFADEQKIDILFYKENVIYCRPGLEIGDDVLAALHRD